MNALTRYGLVFAVVLQLLIYGWIAYLSAAFEFQSAFKSRPILLVLGLLAINFVLHLICLRMLLKYSAGKRSFIWITSISIAMRCILLFSTPIQEVDIYRYMWDGIVASQGVHPFRYSPQQVFGWLDDAPDDSSSLGSSEADRGQRAGIERLVELAANDAGIRETLNRVHYPELRTVYPPTSQVVFAAVALITPEQVAIETRVTIMKTMIVFFDVGTIVLLWQLTTAMGVHPAWTIAYAWSPLILKEFANSGHLDAIAVFLMLSSLLAMLAVRKRRCRSWGICGSGLLIGLAVGAKLFPIVVAPLMGTFLLRQGGWRAVIGWSLVASVATLVVLAPVLFVTEVSTDHSITHHPENFERQSELANDEPEEDSLTGLTTFLTRWEMNDLIFMVIEENLRPDSARTTAAPLWFVFVRDDYRTNLVERIAKATNLDAERIPFLATRVLTLIVFGIVTVWLMRRVWWNPYSVLTACFLSLAWFWLLAPTQNPWYWSWALCLIPFARSRIWLAVSGLALLYYLRFWLLYHFQGETIWGGPYTGVHFFDYVIVWFEFGPVLVALTITGLVRPRLSGPSRGSQAAGAIESA